ncbi:MAG: hypothetical protein L0Y36_09385, partial [Planctomycetales bacterium]|nr:hypothetical protein [Planctomycetales bacterium]
MYEKKHVKVIFILTFLACGFISAKAFAADTKQTANTKEIIIVFKTHFDIGYTEMAKDVVHRYRTSMIDNALRVCDANSDLPDGQHFVWTIPGWPMSKIIEDWPGQTPDRKQRLEQAFKDGRFVVHALPFTTHTETLEPEDLVRGLVFASSVSRKYGFDLPHDAKMTDVPSHSWILPTLLKHAGVDFLHLGCNPASSSPDVPELFWWEGPDGSRLLTMYTSKNYGTPLLPPNDWPYRTWLALIHTGDNQGPPNPEQVKQLLAEVNQKKPAVKVRIGRLSDFGDAIISEKPQLPIVRGDMPDTWIHGPMSDPVGWKTARNIRPLISATETLNTHMNFWDITEREIKPEISTCYEQSLLYGEHTWGASIGWIDCKLAFGEEWTRLRQDGRYKRSEASWDEHTAYINSARDIIEPILEEHLQVLAQAVNVEGRRIVVYNSLPWLRDGLVTVKVKDNNITALKATDSKQIVAVESNGNEIRFFAAHIPAGGYRTFIPASAETGPVPLRADRQSATIESPYFKAKLDNIRGIILSLIDKRTGRELIDASAQHGFGQYLYERFDKSNIDKFIADYVKITASWTVDFQKPGIPSAQDVPYRSTSPNNFTLRFEQTPVSVTAVMDASAGDVPHSVTTRLTLYRELPYADLEIELHDKPMDSWPEGGWICLPLKVDTPNFRIGRLGSIIDPHRDIVAGTNHHLLCLNSGMSVLDNDGIGIGLCP